MQKFNCLHMFQNCLARTVVIAPKSSHITPILRSLHWLKINERIEYKLLSLTYKVLTTSQPDYTILSLFSLQVELAPRLLSPQLDHPYLPHYKSPTALFHKCITLSVESAPFFIPSTSFCSLSSWFTSSSSRSWLVQHGVLEPIPSVQQPWPCAIPWRNTAVHCPVWADLASRTRSTPS